ncbi:hypothetical protein LTR36_008256 [Oleoguttula mirabilis]|uniref:BTB domain-containing protein n=1 Tax=Oleoguttula mirabilis TaxID=1507867 RepID=A0AAV9J7Y6_9PEZI|nr:hypothetical protein LTR36_008256 [Oleoguttula mirabilis]
MADIILALPQQVYVRVSSVVLSYASAVFRTMFGPNFKEGAEPRTSAHPKEISLPDDDPSGMTHLCDLLHGRKTNGDEQTEDGLAEQLWRLAVVADKYDCVAAVSLQTEAMLSRFLLSTGTAKVHSLGATAYLAGAAYHLERNGFFYLFTKRLVLDYYEPFFVVSSQANHEALQAETWLKLAEQRATARTTFLEELPRLGSDKWCHNGCGGGNKSDDFAQKMALKLGRTGHWPPRLSATPLRGILAQVHGVGTVHIAVKCTCGDAYNSLVAGSSVQALARSIYDSAGLCLWCTRAGGSSTGACKHAEDQAFAGPVVAA